MRLIALVLVLFIAACSTLPNSEQVETPFGKSSYYLSGVEKPTLVFESGLGDDMTTWDKVISSLDSTSQVFAYNRAGFTGSYSSNLVRNAEVIVDELRVLLGSLDLPPPYVLVGHSLGGGYMELFAKRYPDEVAAVVLVDPNSSRYPNRCKLEGLDFCDPPSSIPKWASLFLPSAVEGEIEGFKTTHQQINAVEAFPNVPLAVISAGATRKGETLQQQKAGRLYGQVHKEMALMSTTSKFISCELCGHYIQQEQPELVVEAIRWALSKISEKSKISATPSDLEVTTSGPAESSQ